MSAAKLKDIATILFAVAFIALIGNELVRGKYGYTSNRHLYVFWLIIAFSLFGMATALVLLLIFVSHNAQ